MRAKWRRYATMLATGSVLQAAAAADAGLPQHLTGTWATSASLFEGAGPQSAMFLLPDGRGLMAGTSSAAVRADGRDDGTPGPRALAGFPLRASWQEDRQDGVLTARPYFGASAPAAKAGRPPLMLMCRYERIGPVLSCTANAGGATLALTYRGADVPADVVRQIDAVP